MAPLGISGLVLGEGFVDVQLLVVLSLLTVADDSPRSLSLSKLWAELLVGGGGGSKSDVSGGFS